MPPAQTGGGIMKYHEERVRVLKNEHLLWQAREKKAEIQNRWRQKKKNKEPISDTPKQIAAKTARKGESEKHRKTL